MVLTPFLCVLSAAVLFVPSTENQDEWHTTAPDNNQSHS